MSIKGIFPINKWDFKSESILADLPPEDLAMLLQHKIEQTYRKGEVVFKEAGYPNGIYFINSGKVKKFRVDEHGREQIIYVANTGELIGYHAILAEDMYPDSATTLEESIITYIPKEDFLLTLEKSTLLNNRLLKTLSHEFAVLANSISLFSHKSVRERLALQLIVIREKYKVDYEPGMAVEINMSREDLSALVGTARENVVRVLSAFKKEGIVSTKGRKIIVQDINKLIAIANYK
jgi:CRP-like cAMP-binding protein